MSKVVTNEFGTWLHTGGYCVRFEPVDPKFVDPLDLLPEPNLSDPIYADNEERWAIQDGRA